jgi:hypothetical protein
VLRAEEQLSDLKVHMLNVWHIFQHDRAVLGGRLHN